MEKGRYHYAFSTDCSLESLGAGAGVLVKTMASMYQTAGLLVHRTYGGFSKCISSSFYLSLEFICD